MPEGGFHKQIHPSWGHLLHSTSTCSQTADLKDCKTVKPFPQLQELLFPVHILGCLFHPSHMIVSKSLTVQLVGTEKLPGRSCTNTESLLGDEWADTLSMHLAMEFPSCWRCFWTSQQKINTKSTQRHYMNNRCSADFPVLTHDV